MLPSGKPDEVEDLVPEDRLVRTWEYILGRTSGLEGAWPLTWIQSGTPEEPGDRAVFAVAENNPRFAGMLQVSAIHTDLENWQRIEREAREQHPFNNDVERDPLTWVMGQVIRGHGHTMASLRQMSHPVEHVDWKTGEKREGESPTRTIH